MKTGLQKAHERKTKKYEEFIERIKAKTEVFDEISLHCVEVGSRGHIATSLNEIRAYLVVTKKGSPTVEAFLRSLGRTALRGSIFIFKDRNRIDSREDY